MKGEIHSKHLSFSVTYEAAPEGGYVAFVASLPGCHSQGETLEEAEKNIKEAITLYLESLTDHQESLPPDRRILQGIVEVAVS